MIGITTVQGHASLTVFPLGVDYKVEGIHIRLISLRIPATICTDRTNNNQGMSPARYEYL